MPEPNELDQPDTPANRRSSACSRSPGNPFSLVRKMAICPLRGTFLYFATFDDRAEFLRVVPTGKVYANTRYNSVPCDVDAGWWLRWDGGDGLPHFTIPETPSA